ncbi:MAG: NYN domain-containing protein [Candidatus Aenigmatarchaeota archaeon]|nr:MAG: NYN domain-containing protein [Candidatus Aenigmarchaeota archaeon]
MSERVVIFIDGSNFYHGFKNNIGTKDIDFLKFARKLARRRKLVRVYYYNAPADINCDKEKYWKQQEFFDKLRKFPNFELVLVRLQKRVVNEKPIYTIKGDDVYLATHLIVLAYNDAYDTAILVSGDADFIPAIKAVQAKGKQVENYYFMKGGSWHLRHECDNSVLMDENFMEGCLEG